MSAVYGQMGGEDGCGEGLGGRVGGSGFRIE